MAGAFQNDAFQDDALQIEEVGDDQSVSDSDTGSGADDATLEVAADASESGVGVDVAYVDKEEQPADTGSGYDSAYVSKWLGELPSPAPAEVPALIRYDGTDITSKVVITSATFTSSANGRPGMCRLRIRDDDHEVDLVQGRRLTLDVGAVREWSGFVASVRRGYWFNGTTKAPGQTERYFDVIGVDLNVLLQKRVLYDKADPTRTQLSTFPSDTPDSEVLLAYMGSHLDLSGDDIGVALIETVGTPSLDTEISGAAGWVWDSLMQMLTRNTGAVYYIDPDGQMVLTDVDTPNAPFTISDAPAASSDNEQQDSFDRVEAAGWGTGSLGAWENNAFSGADLSVDGDEAIFAGSGTRLPEVPTPAEAMDSDLWTVRARLQWPSSLSGTIKHGVEILESTDFTAEIGAYAGSDGLFWVFAYDVAFDFHEESVVVTLTPDAWATVILEYDRTTGVVRAKYWQDGDAEPDWLVTLPAIPGLVDLDVPGVGVFMEASSTRTFRTSEFAIAIGGEAVQEIGCRDLEIDFGAEAMRNDALMWGIGQGASSPVFARVESESSIAEHHRWQVASLAQAVWRQGTIDRIADSFVNGSPQNRRGGKDDAVSVKCTIFEQGVRVGMKATVRSEVFGFEDVLPVRNLTLSFPTPTTPKYDLILSHEIDSPWTTIEYWWPDFAIPDFGIPGFNFPGFDLPNLPGFPGLPGFDPCAESPNCTVEDNFGREVPSSWGDSDSGHTWVDSVSAPRTRTSSVDGEGLLHSEPGFAAGAVTNGVTQRGSQRLDLDAESELVLPISTLFSFRYEGTWESSEPYNPQSGSPGYYWAPGFAGSSTATALTPSTTWQRAFLRVGTRSTIPLHRFNIYNADGSLWIARWQQNTVSGAQGPDVPVEVGPQLAEGERLMVRLFLDSDRLYIRVWPDGAPEPTFWHLETEATGLTWESGEREFELVSFAQARSASQPPFDLYVDDVCIGTRTYAGGAMGLFDNEVYTTEEFARTLSAGSGIGEGALGPWVGNSDAFSVDGDELIVETFENPLGLAYLELLDAPLLPPVGFVVRQRVSVLNANMSPVGGNRLAYLVRFTNENITGTSTEDGAGYNVIVVDAGMMQVFVGAKGGPINVASVNFDPATTEYFYVRFEMTSDTQRFRVWVDPDPEPTEWDFEIPADGYTVSRVRVQASTQSADGNFGAIDWIRYVGYVGLGGLNPCGRDEPPHADVPPGESQATLDEVAAPDGGDPSSTWFEVPHQFTPGSERVFLNGTLLRPGIDYARHSVDRLIEIFSSVTISPGDEVFITFDIYLSTPAPEIL